MLESVNTAIADMHTDGTLGALWNSNVAELGINDEPVAVVPAVIEGAQTVRVGVSGDIPPLDYTSVDGKPAGYNTAVLAEIAKRAGFNVEFVYMETGARFTALSTGRIDLFFWQLGFERDVLSSDTFTGDLEALTKDLQDVVPCLRSEPYASAKVGWVARTDVVARSDSALLELAREAAAWVAAHPNATPAEVQAYCAELGVDDVCAVDASGAIAISNQAANIGFNFADDEQSAAFLPILRNEITELAQPATPRGVDGAMYRYAGVAGGIDGGLTQVGMRVE
ncbi:MAG: transporter substrate-binding domain-containing protein [Eubacteriales bacterium]|nr:transporter substrate-binding domain-containing protein [Eubacteriales bacterium]MDD3881855.1 transporter substrate-binding domain-containing protein [Eubacteriales bacterium]MDD4512900.1 transporter substrate-binding domain-containing protein [Eubacteriales bacterium]